LQARYCIADANSHNRIWLGSDIVRVINYGSPRTLEELVQEAGCAGRDGCQAEAILYPKTIGKKVTDAMTEYQVNVKKCRKNILFRDFLFSSEHNSELIKACKCCDLCVIVINVDLKYLQQNIIIIEQTYYELQFTQDVSRSYCFCPVDRLQ